MNNKLLLLSWVGHPGLTNVQEELIMGEVVPMQQFVQYICVGHGKFKPANYKIPSHCLCLKCAAAQSCWKVLV